MLEIYENLCKTLTSCFLLIIQRPSHIVTWKSLQSIVFCGRLGKMAFSWLFKRKNGYFVWEYRIFCLLWRRACMSHKVLIASQLSRRVKWMYNDESTVNRATKGEFFFLEKMLCKPEKDRGKLKLYSKLQLYRTFLSTPLLLYPPSN